MWLDLRHRSVPDVFSTDCEALNYHGCALLVAISSAWQAVCTWRDENDVEDGVDLFDAPSHHDLFDER